MNNDLKIKIIGEDTSNLFLAFLLLKKGFKVEIFNNYNISKKIRKEKLFYISHSSKLILEKFNLWSQFKDKAYTIDTLSILETSIVRKIDFSFRDYNFRKRNPKNIGWVFSNFDLDDLFLNEISKFDDVFKTLNIKINSEIKDSHNYSQSTLNENLNKRGITKVFSKKSNVSIEFTASLRGYIDKRHFSIINEFGLIFICPINKNLFSFKWVVKKSFLERILRFGNTFLLDNLTTILPGELMIDEIFGELNITPINHSIFKKFTNNRNCLIIKNGSVKLLDLSLEDLNLSFKEVNFIYDQIMNLDLSKNKAFVLFKFKFLIIKYFKLKITSFFYGFFLINNYFVYFLKIIIFNLFNRVRIFKKFLIKFIILNF